MIFETLFVFTLGDAAGLDHLGFQAEYSFSIMF